MKKLFIFVLSVFLASAAAYANNPQVSNRSQIMTLMSDFSDYEGFETVQVGGIGTRLIKKFLSSAIDRNDPEERAVLDLIKGVNRIAIFEYSGCDGAVKDKLNKKLGRLLPDDNLLIDVKSDGTSAHIYGLVSDSGDLEDLILHAPEENAVICLFGSISMEAISQLMAD